MGSARVCIIIDRDLLRRLDSFVENGVSENRGRAIQDAVAEKLARLERTPLARECAKLDPEFEGMLADQGLPAEVDGWPEY